MNNKNNLKYFLSDFSCIDESKDDFEELVETLYESLSDSYDQGYEDKEKECLQ